MTKSISTQDQMNGVASVTSILTLAVALLADVVFSLGVNLFLIITGWLFALLAVVAVSAWAGKAFTLARLGEIERIAFEQDELDPRIAD